MTKRIVSGIFVLTALGALGVILAGALTSGEQLIVRFLTAVTVAALGLYVISDLRLQHQGEVDGAHDHARSRDGAEVPANSTAAFMATVTGQHRTRPRTMLDQDAGPTTSTATFESIEPVTAASAPYQPISTPDTAAAVTASARRATPAADLSLVAPITMIEEDRPAPMAGDWPGAESAVEMTPVAVSGPRAIPPMPSAASRMLPPHPDITTGVGSPAAVADEPASALPTTPVRTAGAFTYSGPLTSQSEAWPPKPNTEADNASTGGFTDGDTTDTTATADDDGPGPEIDAEDGIDTVEDIYDVDVDLSVGADLRPHERRLEAAQYAGPARADLIDLTRSKAIGGSTTVAAPSPAPKSDRLASAIRSGETQVINTLIQQGMLSTEGAITDRDVRTMVYVAFTSNELRKLILAGGTPDGVKAADLDLGPVELFDESRYAPLPKTIYTGRRTLSPVVEESDVIDVSTSAPANDIDLDEPVEITPPLPTPKHIYRRVGVDATIDG